MSTALSARRRIITVLGGGFCGTVSRYLLSMLLQSWLGKGWPYDILLINITGAFLLALVTTLADGTFLVGPTRRLFINVGFFGAYTTFSALALGDVLLFAREQWLPALLYLIVSSVGGVLAVLLGDWLAQWFINKARRSTGNARTRMLTGGLTFPAHETARHLDIQDDVLLPDRVDEPGARQKRP